MMLLTGLGAFRWAVSTSGRVNLWPVSLIPDEPCSSSRLPCAGDQATGPHVGNLEVTRDWDGGHYITELLMRQGGPRLQWAQLTSASSCQGESCAVFRDARPGTMAVSVLVVVEMFNALNALSENNSLLQVLQTLACAAC